MRCFLEHTRGRGDQGGPGPTPSGRGKGVWLRAHWLTVLGWAISAAALWYILSRVQLSLLKEELAGVTWWLMGAAVVMEIIPRVLQAIRWRSLLAPISTRFLRLLQAVYIGVLYSAILPLSLGDAVRAVVVARETNMPFTRIFSTVLLERMTDAVALVLVVWFALRGLALPPAFGVIRTVLEMVVGIAIVAGVVVIRHRSQLTARLRGWQPSNRFSRGLRSTGLDFVQAIGWVRPRVMAMATGGALLAAIANVFAYWLMLRAYHIGMSPIQAAGLYAILTIGMFLPNTPGNVGSWQFFCAIGLQMFGIPAAQAAGFSIVAWAVWTIPPVLFGVVALLTSPFKWSDLRANDLPPGTPLETGQD